MTKLNEIYRCSVCGNIVEVIHPAVGQLVCCGKPMQLLTENTVDAAKEKHVPVIEKTDKGYKVKVGATEHPMLDEHYIEFIELMGSDCIQRKYLKPGDKPEADFSCCCDKVSAREYCNIHGLWKSSAE
ncbi:MAG: desulfoferrodoxin [Prevotella sp.]